MPPAAGRPGRWHGCAWPPPATPGRCQGRPRRRRRPRAAQGSWCGPRRGTGAALRAARGSMGMAPFRSPSVQVRHLPCTGWTLWSTPSGTPTTTTTRRSTPSPATSTRRSAPAPCSGPPSTGGSTTCSAARSAGPSPTPPSTPSPSRAACSEFFRGNPNQVNPLELLRDHEPIRARVPRSGGPGGGARRARPGRVLPLPDPRDDLRGAAARGPRSRLPHVPGLQPLARSTTGPSTTRAASSRLRTSPSPTTTGPSRSWSGPSTNGARLIVMRAGAPTTVTGRRSPFDASFDPVLGPGGRGRHHGGGPRRRQRSVLQRLRRRRVRRQLPPDRPAPHASRASTSRRPSTTTSCR